MNTRLWLRRLYLIVLVFSLVLLVVYVRKFDFEVIPKVMAIQPLVISVVLLLCGFVMDSATWMYSVKSYGYRVSLNDSFISNGLSIFTKYIPGKVMVILGRAMRISQGRDMSIKKLSMASLVAQLSTMFVGLLIGMVSVFSLNIPKRVMWLAFALAILLFFSMAVIVFALGSKRFKFKLSGFDYRRLDRVMISSLVNWLFWCTGFLFLVKSSGIVAQPDLSIGALFAFAAVMAIASLVAPGGLGVREGLLVGGLVASGVSLEGSTAIGILSRVWFVAGEVLFFGAALFLRYFVKPSVN